MSVPVDQSQYNVVEWSNMSTCGLVVSVSYMSRSCQYNVVEWSNMSTCGLL